MASIGGQEASKNQIILLGVLGTVLVSVMLYLFVFSGGDDPAETNTLPAAAPEATEASPSPEASPDELPRANKKGTVETYEVYTAKDPFEPLIDEGGSDDGSSASAGSTSTNTTATTPPPTVGDGTVTTGTTPTTPTFPTVPTTTPPSNGNTTGGNTTAPQGRRIHLYRVIRKDGKKPFAKVKVGQDTYVVKAGNVFAKNFKVVSFDKQCANMLYGDEPFEICKGETLIK